MAGLEQIRTIASKSPFVESVINGVTHTNTKA